MIRKITLRGYNTHVPFKLFYLCDDDGVSDLSEAFKVLLLLPYGKNEELSVFIKTWAVASYKKDLDEIENSRPYFLSGTDLDAWHKAEASKKESLKTKLLEVSQELLEDMKQATSIVVPFSMNKKPASTTLKYIGNKRFLPFKELQKMEKSMAEKYSWGHLDGWSLTSLERTKRKILSQQRWLKNAKLILKGEVTRHPCMLCPRALEQLEGKCGFGGMYCNDSLGLAISNITQGVGDGSK
jgi:hypothetical protein